MTIEKAVGILSNGLVNAPSEHEWCEAFKTAIDTMRKYQKLERVLDKIRADITDCLKALDDVEKFNIYLPNEVMLIWRR